MKILRFILLSSVLIHFSSPLYAQTLLSDPLHLRVARQVAGMGSQLASSFSPVSPLSSGPVALRVPVSGGAIVPYVGVAAVGTGVVMAALAAYYNGKADSELDALGTWYRGGVALAAPAPIVTAASGLIMYPVGEVCRGVTDGKSHIGYMAKVRPNPDNDPKVKDRFFVMYSHWSSNLNKAEYISVHELQTLDFAAAYSYLRNSGSCRAPIGGATLGDLIASNPQAADKFAEIVSRYIATNPSSLGQIGWETYPSKNQLDDALTIPGIDTDSDGYTDAAEVQAKTDPSNSKSKPTTKPDASTNVGAPAVPKPEDPKSEPPPKKKEPPVSNDCGDFSLSRALKFPAHVLKDIFIPCDKDFFSNYFSRLHAMISSKFPFGFIDALRGTSISISGSSSDGALPSSLGMFTLDWSQFQKLFFFASLFFKSSVSFLGVNFLISRLSGQVVIK